MHFSYFSYNLRRPYPYQWFTAIVIIGGFVFTALFTFVTIAMNGYDMIVEYTSSPNATMKERHWYQQPPWSWTNHLRPKCQAANLAVGTDFFTTNLGLTHHIQSEWGEEYSNGTRQALPAIPYLANRLQDCNVSHIEIKMGRADRCTGKKCFWLSWGRTIATATTTCRVDRGNDHHNLNITTSWDANPRSFASFVNLDSWNQGSIWWGAWLLSMWFQALRTQMARMSDEVNVWDWLDVIVRFDTSKDIQDMDFINYLGSVGKASGQIVFTGNTSNIFQFVPLSSWKNDTRVNPYIAQQLDGFAKSFYSVIMADLGQQKGPNILSNPDDLQYYLAGHFDQNRTTDTVQDYNISAIWHPKPVPASESYKVLNVSNSMGPLGIRESHIFLQYSCRVPQIKNAAQLLWTLVVGNLVFLTLVWHTFKWLVDWWLQRTDHTSMTCPGCLQHLQKSSYETTLSEDKITKSGSMIRFIPDIPSPIAEPNKQKRIITPTYPKTRNASWLPTYTTTINSPRKNLHNESSTNTMFSSRIGDDWSVSRDSTIFSTRIDDESLSADDSSTTPIHKEHNWLSNILRHS